MSEAAHLFGGVPPGGRGGGRIFSIKPKLHVT
jgi:hypothetical protein